MTRSLTLADLKPYLEFLGQRRPIPFTLKTADGETLTGTIQGLKPTSEGQKVVHLEIVTAEIGILNQFGREIGTKHRDYPIGCSEPIFLGEKKDPKSVRSLFLRSYREMITFLMCPDTKEAIIV